MRHFFSINISITAKALTEALASLTPERQEILSYLGDHAEITPTQIAEGLGMRPDEVNRHLDALERFPLRLVAEVGHTGAEAVLELTRWGAVARGGTAGDQALADTRHVVQVVRALGAGRHAADVVRARAGMEDERLIPALRRADDVRWLDVGWQISMDPLVDVALP